MISTRAVLRVAFYPRRVAPASERPLDACVAVGVVLQGEQHSMPRSLPSSKAEVREMIWRAMEVRGVARFPGTKGRIPNFVGAERAALQLQKLPAWRAARVVKINPDAPQLPVRRLALREGKVVYMAVPRLRALECFLELDPKRLGARALQAAPIKGAERLGR